uniref:NAD(P)H-quinone oxidoreductase subunit 5, chloroplastic n=1 Tax=Scutellaria baicalensis TaxID=65409 RepID=A0A0G3F3Z3_SCUBA|nr:NADH dehydrogenase subunit 5 [Scutellaria baicalensis]AKJ77134.1 NADH dehydrogenase subunit 5 [Scutellaria baicalensis]
MEQTYQYVWILPFVPLPVPMLIGVGLLLFPTATKNLHRMWAFPSILLLSIVMIFSTNLSIQQINSSSIYQYVWSWTLDNDFSLEFGCLIDPLTSIMSMLITTVGIMVLIYSDNYMAHDQGYLRFFAYMSFFSTSMLGLVTSSNLIQIYIFWELVGMCSYLLIGFWFTRPPAANACQKAFVTNRVGDFGLLLGILGFYWITGSFEFQDLFEILNNLIYNNEVNFPFVNLCAALLFAGAVAKSAQFPLHVWLPDAMEGPTPISALIHAATMVAAGIFLVARLLPLFIVIPYIMNLISLIGIITLLLGATLALAQKDIKRGLAYSTMSQLGYIMFALGMGSYRSALFHLITHAYSKALLFLGSGSVIHSMETLVGYSPDKSQNIVLMGGLTKHVPITKTSFLLGTLSLCGIPPLACFWSKDEILNDSWLYSPIFAIIAWATAGLTAFYMFRIYLLTFEGHLNVYFQNYSGAKNTSFYSISLWGKGCSKRINKNFRLLRMNNNESSSFFSKKTYPSDENVRKKSGRPPFINILHFDYQKPVNYPYDSDNNDTSPIYFVCWVSRNSFLSKRNRFRYINYMVSSVYKSFTSKVNEFGGLVRIFQRCHFFSQYSLFRNISSVLFIKAHLFLFQKFRLNKFICYVRSETKMLGCNYKRPARLVIYSCLYRFFLYNILYQRDKGIGSINAFFCKTNNCWNYEWSWCDEFLCRRGYQICRGGPIVTRGLSKKTKSLFLVFLSTILNLELSCFSLVFIR